MQPTTSIMKAINITLIFDGQTEAAFNFYKSVFGGEFDHVQRMKDLPDMHGIHESEKEKILHIALPAGDSILMGMDAPTGRMVVNKGNNFTISIGTSSEEETTIFFNGLAAGGLITMPLAHQFWGAFFGMVTDKFGIQWSLSYATE
jgi:PhnB protein